MNIGTYALRSFRHNASKGVVLMIALSVMLVITVLNIATTMQKTMSESAVSSGGDAHVRYGYITSAQAEVLSSHESVEWADLWLILGSWGEVGGESINLTYSSRCGLMEGFKMTSGDAPQAVNEVALAPHMAKLLGIEDKVGEKFTLSVSNNDGTVTSHDFVVSGIIQNQPYHEKSENYYIFLSETFVLEHGKFSEQSGRTFFGQGKQDTRQMFVHFKDSYFPTEIGGELAKLAGVEEGDYSYNYSYLYADLNDPGFVIVFGIIILVLLATGALVINNAFTMLAARRTRSFGLLTLIGASKRQIRACVYIEALLDTAVALPIGLLMGTAFSYAGMPLVDAMAMDELNVVFYAAPWAYGLTILLAAVMTLIGVARPARKASKVTPVEAVRFSGATEKQRKRREETNLTPPVLARINMGRNRGRTVSVILSLSISGVLFLALSTMGFSMLTSSGNLARHEVVDDIQILVGTSDVLMPGSEALSPEIANTLKCLDGVESAKTFMAQGYCAEFEERSDGSIPETSGNIIGMEDGTLREMLELVTDGAPDWESLHNGIDVLAVNWTDEYAVHYGQFNYTLGQEITVYLADKSGLATEQTVTLRIAGILSNYDFPPYVRGWGGLPTLVMPQSAFTPNGFFDSYHSISLEIDDTKHDKLVSAIDSICKQNGELFYKSYLERKQEYEQQMMGLIALVFMILGIVALVGIMNLISSTFIGVEQRQREFGVLAAMGLSPKGLRELLTREGVMVSAVSISASTALGLLGGYWLYWFMSVKGGASYMSYSFPLISFLVLLAIYGFVPYLVTRAAVKRLSRQTTVELLGQGM